MNTKTTRFYSVPLMKQNIKSNWILTVVICFVFCLMTTVVCFAMNIVGGESTMTDEREDAQTVLFAHLAVIASYNKTAGAGLSAEDFMESTDKSVYEMLFEAANKQSANHVFGVSDLEAAIECLQDDGDISIYEEQFEYVYALSDETGIFSGRELTMEDMLTTMLNAMGLPADRLTNMAEMDKTTMLNTMYFTVMGLLPTFLFIVIVGNSLIVNQVDSGSMAYILATPTKRSAVANTQALFLIISPMIICSVACVVRCVATNMFMGDVNVKMNIALYIGMYILVEAVGGICFMGSCLFTQSRKAIAFGGGIAVWCFISSLLGMFGAEDMVNMGIGVEELAFFNKLTLVGLYDVKALSTVGSDSVNYDFVWKLCVLAMIAIVSYLVGKISFQKKDLPL